MASSSVSRSLGHWRSYRGGMVAAAMVWLACQAGAQGPSQDALRARYGLKGGAAGYVVEDIRTVDDTTYHVHALKAWFQRDGKGPRPMPAWQRIQGRVVSRVPELDLAIVAIPTTRMEGNVLVESATHIAVRNYLQEESPGRGTPLVYAMRLPGRTYTVDGFGELELWDCGTRLTPQELQALRAKGATNRASVVSSRPR